MHPEVSFAAAPTGPANLHASINVPTGRLFYRYLTESVATLAVSYRWPCGARVAGWSSRER